MPEGSRSSPSHIPMGEESPRLSVASISSDERAPSAAPSDPCDPPPASDRRPLSLISTLSSGSGSSRDDCVAPPAPEEDDDSDARCQNPGPEKRGRSFVDNKAAAAAAAASRASGRRPLPFAGAAMVNDPKLKYLDRIVMEIIETERMYVRDLKVIVEDYLAHIIDESELSNHPKLVCDLFGNIEDIYEFNSELLQDLERCDNDPVAIASCFVSKSEDFDIYTQYCTCYPESVEALTKCMNNKSVARFFQDRQASLKHSLPLGSYLLKPVQRILKYHLLLQEIAKHFGPQQVGCDVVEEALYTMTWVAWYINDMKRKHEHAVRLQEVQSLLVNWKGPDLTTYGELVLEGTFKVPRARHERTLFLFDRMLLITKRRGEHFVYKTHISSSTLLLIESAKDSLSFSVSHYKHLKQTHNMQAKTVEEKKLWAHHIKRIILENHQAAIPQKAKEAILEMDSIGPARFRFSPERLKKADEFPRDARQGRRQSEPTKQMLKRNKAPLEQAVSQDALAAGRRSLQDASSSSSCSSSLGCSSLAQPAQPDLDDFLLEDEQEAEKSCKVATKENGQFSEDELIGPEPTPEQSADALLQEKPLGKPEDSEPEPPAGPDPPAAPEVPQMSADLQPDEDPEPADPPSSSTFDSDSKTLSSAESSDEDEREAAAGGSGSPSILPSSVLDRAGAIARHFSSIRRGSLAQEDVPSLGCPSPRPPSRTGSLLGPRSESSDPAEASGGPDPGAGGPLEPDRRRRRDSTLSKQDQLLIGKIKSYYEDAETRDAGLGLRRRESLTYIPSGLVRSSVSRFNGVQRAESDPPAPAQDPDPDPVPTDRLVSSRASDSDDPLSGDCEEPLRFRPPHDDLPEEEFRSSSEMIKIWQAMERRISRSQSEDRGSSRSRETVKPSGAAGSFTQTKSCDPDLVTSDLVTSDLGNPDLVTSDLVTSDLVTSDLVTSDLVTSDLGAVAEDSFRPSPPKPRAALGRAGSRTGASGGSGVESAAPRAPAPRVAQLRAGGAGPAEETLRTDEADGAESKVRLLARRYSQRIRTGGPAARRQRSPAGPFSRKALACVLEEKEGSGKPGPTLPLAPKVQSLPLSPVDPVQNPGGGGAAGHAPLSPPPPAEGFSWPDVRELRSRYSSGGGRNQNRPMSRSSTIPDRMPDAGLRRHSSGSPGRLHGDGASSGRPGGGTGGRAAARDQRSKRLHRANSLDPQRVRRAAEPGYYVAAEAPLTDDPEHKIIIMEKLPEPGGPTRDDGFVQIRSPTSREQISIMAVIDRCHRLRDAAATAPPPPPEPGDAHRTRPDAGQNGVVKNLREKFQSQT